jgi:hypothetical protein
VRGEWQKTRRMTESAALLVDNVLPHKPIRQWVLSFPFQLRFLFASYPHFIVKVLDFVYRTLATQITKKTGYNKKTAKTGVVTLIQRFGSTLNLNIHFHMLYLDGVYAEDNYGKTRLDEKHPCFSSYLQPEVVQPVYLE